MRQYPNLIDGNEIEFGRDPNRVGITRMFDDFLGGTNNTQISAQFNTFGSVSGGAWNIAQSYDTLNPTGFDDFGTVQAETNTGGTARAVMHLAQLMKSSPSDGDRWMWEVRVKPSLATGNGFWSMSIVRTDSGDGYFNLDGAPITNNLPRMSIFAKHDEAKWQSHKADNTASAAGTTAATSIDFTDDAYVKIASLVEFQSAGGGRYAVKFYVDGVEAFSDRLTVGTGSPFGKCFLYNNGTTTAQTSTYDWSLIQFTRTDAVDYLDIDSIA
tara:strand:- start:73 stop:882 length:810 start_codon:yes stop_codon:yes gene_type:complete